MISWSIEAAMQSNCFDKIVVSTDSEDIKSKQKKWGMGTIFKTKRSL